MISQCPKCSDTRYEDDELSGCFTMCRECNYGFTLGPPEIEPDAPRQSFFRRHAGLIFASLLAAFGVACVLAVAIAMWPPNDERDAHEVAKAFIHGIVKSPATAVYQPYEDTTISEKDGYCKVDVLLDVQNGFGALLRFKMRVELFFVPTTGKWEVLFWESGETR